MKTTPLYKTGLSFLIRAFLLTGFGAMELHAAGAASVAEAQAVNLGASSVRFSAHHFDWSKAANIATGLKRTSFVVEQPRLMRGSCVRVDLSEPTIAFYATGRAPEWGQAMPDHTNKQFVVRTRRTTAREFMLHSRRSPQDGGLGLDMRVVVNANPWSPWQHPWNHKFADRTGLIVSRGQMVAPATGRPSLVVYRNGQMEFRTLKRHHSSI